MNKTARSSTSKKDWKLEIDYSPHRINDASENPCAGPYSKRRSKLGVGGFLRVETIEPETWGEAIDTSR